MEKRFVPVMITPFNLKAKIDFDMVGAVDRFLPGGRSEWFFCQLPQQRNVQHQRRRAA